MADTEQMEHFEREGWLASKQRAWVTAPGTPPRGARQPSPGGWFGGTRQTLMILAAVLAALLVFSAIVTFVELTHGGEEAGGSESTSGGAEGGEG